MKILNAYAGIGGNRKLWGDEHEITAVEYKPEIAAIYHDFFPKDKIIVVDAHQYLLEHYAEYDFIWASPPCPTHSKARQPNSKAHPEKQKPCYPDMKLYEEIIFLKHYFNGKWCVENVISYYEPLIPPMRFSGHYFWTNFALPPYGISGNTDRAHDGDIESLVVRKAMRLKPGAQSNTRLLLRNCVEPELGKHILDWAIKPYHLNKQLFPTEL